MYGLQLDEIFYRFLSKPTRTIRHAHIPILNKRPPVLAFPKISKKKEWNANKINKIKF